MIPRKTKKRESDVPGFTDNEILGFIYDAVIWKKPSVSLEIGTFMGRTALTICEALDELDSGELICIDFFPQSYDEQYLNRPFMQSMINQCGPEIRKLYTDFEKLKRLEDCYHLTLARHPVLKKYSKLIKCDTKELDFLSLPNIDFAYIDGAHAYDGVKNDFLGILRILKPGGMVIFDDNSKNFPGVMRLIKEAELTGGIVYVGHEKHDIGFNIPDPKGVLEALVKTYSKVNLRSSIYNAYWNVRYKHKN